MEDEQVNGYHRRLTNLENALSPQGGICCACFIAGGDGFADCARPELHGDRRRCGKYADVTTLSDAELEQIVTARAACYGLDMETYLAQVAEQEGMSFPTL